MKKLIKLPAWTMGLLLLTLSSCASPRVAAQEEGVSLQTFYDELSPYGTWIQDREYGYVWRPDVDQGEFRPYYSNGRWAMTEYGNTWVSDYDWGWAPFHYGRWAYNRYRQWVWIPDTVWGPAWVSWRSGGDYYGWAPLGPGIHVSVNIPSFWWVFVPQRHIYYDRFPRYNPYRNTTIIHNTTIINNTYVRNNRTYYAGPRAADIRRATNTDVRVYDINRTARPSRSTIGDRSVNIYTPRVSRTAQGSVPAPRNVVQADQAYSNSRESRSGNTDSQRPTGTTGSRPAGTQGSRPSRGEQRETVREQPQQSRTAERENRGDAGSRRLGDMQQAEQQRQAVEQQRERRDASQRETQQRQADEQRQRAEQQRQVSERQRQAESQRQQAEQQRQASQREAQQRQAEQQRQQQRQQAPSRTERVSPAPSPSRGNSAPQSRGSSGGSSPSGSRPTRGGR